jgi:hypothetical protein
MQYEDDPELASELTPAELRVVAQQPPITADDVLDMHGFLEEFDGDFEGLIGA